ncbi:MAG: class I SAM-dependent methyltransferase [Ruminococcaceae bacterium]|nr:class I SAM-dependent methyltransferase [Oscillospiraceae bacterium]
MNNEYTVLPAFYDELNSDVDYEAYASFICSKLTNDTPDVLDLGCGTGDLSHILALRGANVVGLDASSEMLTLASHKSEMKRAKVFYTCQNMTSFSTGRMYDAVISTFDCLNYLLTKADLLRAFNCVSKELKDDGIFIFDMNTEYKFVNIYADNSYVLESDRIFCAWENYYDEKSKKCDFYINIFAEENGMWRRYFEEQTERMFTLDEIKSALKKAGLTFVSVSSDYDGSPVTDTTERYYIIAKK